MVKLGIKARFVGQRTAGESRILDGAENASRWQLLKRNRHQENPESADSLILSFANGAISLESDFVKSLWALACSGPR